MIVNKNRGFETVTKRQRLGKPQDYHILEDEYAR
jgi:hypothetical protein